MLRVVFAPSPQGKRMNTALSSIVVGNRPRIGPQVAKPNARTPRGMPDRRGWFPTQEGSACFDGKGIARCSEKRSKPRQKKRNPRRSLALPEGGPFSFGSFLLGKQKKRTDAAKKAQMPDNQTQKNARIA